MPSASHSARPRVSLLALCAIALGACESTDRLTSASDDVTDAAVAQPVKAGPAFLNAGTGGLPFGFFHLPGNEFSATYTGSLRGVSSATVLAELNAARAAGGSIIISLVGADHFYKDDDGHFSLDIWKGRLAPYRTMNFASYVTDGTLIGHYLMDEPNDASNWNGTTVSPATVEEMAKYSKSLWPTVPTIVRVAPAYLKGRTYQYLDAAWAQYHSRFKDPTTWLTKQVTDAKAAGLAVVGGMNILAGGTITGGMPGYYSDQYAMGAAELLTWGTALLADPYPCAFLSWRHNSFYLARADIKASMASLAAKARAKGFKACRGSAQAGPPPPPPTNQPPVAAFTAPSCTVGVPCQFNDASTDDGGIASRTWTFGDGKSSTLQDPTNTYATANTYTVSLTVRDAQGLSKSISKNVTVVPVSQSNPPPTAAFNPPSCTAGVACQFTDGSSDVGGSIAGWSWNFGDGTSSNLRNPSHNYSSGGTRTVTLTVTDNGGATGFVSKQVAVAGTPSTIVLTVTTRTDATTQYMTLNWTGASGTTVDVHRNGPFLTNTPNDGVYTNSKNFTGAATYVYQVCQVGTTICSNEATAQFGAAPPPPENVPPTANFTAPSCTAGIPCEFTDASTDPDGTIASRSWAFGDGNSSTLEDPTNTYTTANTYTVTLTVTDNSGGTNATTKNVIATAAPSNQPPVAGFTPPSCTVGTPCQFNDGSSDPDGTIASRTWTFDGGQTSTLKDPTFVYASASIHTVTLAVTDNGGATGFASKQVAVAVTPSTIVLTVTTRTDATKQYMTLKWTGASGTTVDVHRNGPFLTNTANDGQYTNSKNFTGPATYVYKVCQVGTSICSNEATAQFGAPPPPPNVLPTANFTAPSCTAGIPCQFNDASTDGDGTIATRSWAFGDGQTSTQTNPTTTYAAAGPYTVTLAVTDDDGAPHSVSRSLTVNNPPAAAFTPPSCTAGTPCQFNDASTDGDGTIATRSWAFGDGQTSTEANPTTTYAAAGPYTVTLAITDDDGGAGSVTHSLTVVPPVAPPVTPLIALSVTGKVEGAIQYMTLTWTGATGATLDVYRDGVFKTNTANDGRYTNSRNYQKPITYTYKVCEKGTTTQCSNSASVTFP